MPEAVDRVLRKVMSRGARTKAQAIAILKSNGTIVQNGRHLAEGPTLRAAEARKEK